MPRPPRCRRICDTPQVDTFCPSGRADAEPILLTLDEYEAIRLVDLEQQTHEQCAAQMDISRSTVRRSTRAHGESSRRVLSMQGRCASPAEATASAAGRSIRAAGSAAGPTKPKDPKPITKPKEKLL